MPRDGQVPWELRMARTAGSGVWYPYPMIRGGGDTVELRPGILAATGTVPGDRLEFQEVGPA